DYPALRLKLQQAPRRDPSYNKIVHELNVLSSGIEAGRAELDDVRRKAGEVQGEINAFLTAFDEFNVLMAKGPGFAGKRDLSAEESEFYGWMRRSAEAMEENFRTLSVGEAKRGSHIVVQAAINDRGRASLLVDTGATFTVLSQRAAQALGINPEGSPGSARLHLADGRAVYGQVAILDSVEVAGMTAHRVEAVILPEFEEGLDGLLGMSFLKRFDVRVDPEAGRLILRDMK
ncbi:MAG: retroviral-like aspartic protease family protein, partial [Elusimicrobia bacterium]|nr:retroviral-like aspartic protease family protein [Elusimicrobiota bacterium]